MPDTSVDTTPPPPDLDVRVGRLEREMGDVKAILGQMLPLIVRIDATLPHLATKAEMQAAFGALDGKIGDLRIEMHSESASCARNCRRSRARPISGWCSAC